MNEENKSNKPTVYTLGNVKVACFENTHGDYTIESFQIQKFYKDKQGEWQNSNSLAYNELKILRDLLNKIFDERERLKVTKQ